MLAVGKKERPAVSGMELRIEMRDRGRRTACRGNLVEDVAHCRRKDDDAACAPRTAARTGRIAQSANYAGADVEYFQLGVIKKTDAGAVGRPKGKDSTVCARQDAFCAGAQGAIPKFVARAENDGAAVWRESRRCALISLDLERSGRRRIDERVGRKRGDAVSRTRKPMRN